MYFYYWGLNEFDFGIWEGMKLVDLYENEEYWVMKKIFIEYKVLENGGEIYE